jgi:hypothetical protein
MGPLERTNLYIERRVLRKSIAADEAAIRVEDEVPGSFAGGRYVGSTTRMDHRDGSLKRLANIEAMLEPEV